MKKTSSTRKIVLADPEATVEIKKHPSMGFVFLKALLLSFFRANTLDDDDVVNKTRIVLKNVLPDKDLIRRYKTVCGFSIDKPDIIPISYLQTLFIGLLGKFITASFFPVNPLGLIQIFQSFEQIRPVKIDERLDLSCRLNSITKTEKGIETGFCMDLLSEGQLVWKGNAVFLTKSRKKIKKKSKKKEDVFLEKKETLLVPSDTGRKYAAVSGDYNPHHLYPVLAKLFGFKRAIVHGMWSLARVIASLEKEIGIHDSAIVEAAFKLPIFMPAAIALGYEHQASAQNNETLVIFELRDNQKGLPHLKGRLLNKTRGS